MEKIIKLTRNEILKLLAARREKRKRDDTPPIYTPSSRPLTDGDGNPRGGLLRVK